MLNNVRDEYSNLKHLVYLPDANYHLDNKWWASAAFVDNLANAKRFVEKNNIAVLREKHGTRFSRQNSVANQIANITLTSNIALSVVDRLNRFTGERSFP